MTIQLADMLSDLREDHRNTSIMLGLLERETERLRRGEEPDYRLMFDIMRYMTVYSDAVHHSNEDVLYEVMKTRAPDLAEGLDRVPAEHTHIAELGETLFNDLDTVVAGGSVDPERLVADAADYIRRLREHMAWEEGDLFIRADTFIAGERAVDSPAAQRQPDPVFGPRRDESFASLLRRIDAASGES